MPILIKALPTIHFFIGLVLAILALAFLLRIILSWYPQINPKNGIWIVCYWVTEPVLKITRSFISPIGGVDITPVIWFGVISLVRELLVGPQGIFSQILIQLIVSK